MKADLTPNTLAEFWRWYEANEDELFHLDQNSNELFDRLTEAMHRVDQNLTFEFSPVLKNGSREFIISAAGNKCKGRPKSAAGAGRKVRHLTCG